MNVPLFRIQKAKKDIDKIGTKNFGHSKGLSLYHHLVRVQEILEFWGCDVETQLVGLYHSLYPKDVFKPFFFEADGSRLLRSKLGERVEYLIYISSISDRDSFRYDVDKNVFSFKDYRTNETLYCDYEAGVKVIHVMLANDIDHIDINSEEINLEEFKRYSSFQDLFCDKAKIELRRLLPLANDKSNDEEFYFFPQQGVGIFNKDVSVFIDPISMSDIEYGPALHSRVSHQSLSIVCLSRRLSKEYFLREIVMFAKINSVTVVCPYLEESILKSFLEEVGDYVMSRIHFVFYTKHKNFQYQGAVIKITPFESEGVLMSVSLGAKHVMYIGATIVKEYQKMLQSGESIKSYKSDIDLLVFANDGCLQKEISYGERIISEKYVLSPQMLATLTSKFKPKNVFVMHAISKKKNYFQFEQDTCIFDRQFSWCIAYLDPSIKVIDFPRI